jgi:hypothetical protein
MTSHQNSSSDSPIDNGDDSWEDVFRVAEEGFVTVGALVALPPILTLLILKVSS